MTANKDTDNPVIDDSAETPVTVRLAGPEDLVAITRAHQRALGPGRYALTAYRVREGTPPLSQFCHVAESGKVGYAVLPIENKITLGASVAATSAIAAAAADDGKASPGSSSSGGSHTPACQRHWPLRMCRYPFQMQRTLPM